MLSVVGFLTGAGVGAVGAVGAGVVYPGVGVAFEGAGAGLVGVGVYLAGAGFFVAVLHPAIDVRIITPISKTVIIFFIFFNAIHLLKIYFCTFIKKYYAKLWKSIKNI
ncbi:hypothetical protein CDSM653_01532 [Caldanaerobacter subterraneus subsp. pacificus DSM 12653]|jgi:hypothetical protein|uniref:Uncharacterized protein n=1 Tax=Caldanaerobacter subterraneus subsp. pacificus DSM 12653 TaxID=391606 RepID=A0A0F5PL60_9THEO|nr:hypothetical protein CDSM653_01532 [Caldanaerobacter subterraneus subsp. pacificus DSM 12653]